MERFVKGDIVVLDFPFSNLKSYKRRPSLIIKVPKGEDIIICQITAESQEPMVEIPLNRNDFSKGSLKRDSFLRIDKITTLKMSRIKYKIGALKSGKFKGIMDRIISFLKD